MVTESLNNDIAKGHSIEIFKVAVRQLGNQAIGRSGKNGNLPDRCP
jgi:hypothetical protein